MKYSIKVALIQIKIIIFLLDDKKLLPIRNSTITSATKTSQYYESPTSSSATNPGFTPTATARSFFPKRLSINWFSLSIHFGVGGVASVSLRRCRCVGRTWPRKYLVDNCQSAFVARRPKGEWFWLFFPYFLLFFLHLFVLRSASLNLFK